MAGDVYWSNVSLLCHFEGSDEGTSFVDSGPIGHTLTTGGSANTEADQAKWGSTSGEFVNDFTESSVSASDHASFQFGTGDFTVEFWAYPDASTSGTRQLLGIGEPVSPNAFSIRRQSGSATGLRLYASSDGGGYDIASNLAIGSMTASSWNHIAVVRESGVWSFYVNGTRIDTLSDATALYNSGDPLYIGGSSITGGGCYIDDLRITKGVARYSGASLTVPTEAFPEGLPGVEPGVGSLTLTGVAPTTDFATKELPVGVAALVAAGATPDIVIPLSPGAGAAAFSGAAPSLAYGASPIVGTRALNVTGNAPTPAVTEYGAAVSLEALTLDAYVTSSYIVGDGVLGELTAQAVVINPGVAVGAASFEALTCVAYDDARGGAELEPLSAQAIAVPGRVPRGSPSLRALTLEATAYSDGASVGAAQFRHLTAQASAESESLISAAASLSALQGTAAALSGGAASADAAFSALVAEAVAYGGTDAIAAASFSPLAMDAIAEAAVTSTLNTWVMNTRTRGLTRYPSYPANSFARYNGTYLAAGPTGLFDMQGSDSTGVAWEYRVGDHDEQTQRLKRCTAVLLDVIYENPITVTVEKDSNTSFSYPLPNYRPDVLHQVRVVPGKGMRGRHFQVGAKGTGRLEMHSMIITLPQTSRRVG